MNLAAKHCVPYEDGMPPLPEEKEDELIKEVSGWILVSQGVHKLTRQFIFKDFKESIAFVNRVAELAESEVHHPDIKVVYNKVQLDLFTHAVGGLSENDFIMAAKINSLTS